MTSMIVHESARRRNLQTGAKWSAMASILLVSAVAQAAPSPGSDPVLFWNDVALQFVPGSAPVQTRAYAMVNIAMHDAVNAATGGRNRSYLGPVANSGGDSRAAASQAARDVLVSLNPANAAQYDLALAQSLALIPDSNAKAAGIATGSAYAAAVLSRRAADGSTQPSTYTPSGLPGGWQPTPPGGAPAALGQWGDVDPFLLSSSDQLRPSPPPALGTQAYADAVNEVRSLGSATSITRTQDQTESALFWAGANGSQWLRIGVTIAEDEGLSTLQSARAFATLTTALADTQIAGFDAKYHYDLWRPVTAIRLADIDGNDATVADPAWTPLNSAPAHPSYISTLSALSGAGYTILADLFGDHEAFCLGIGMGNRCFDSLASAAIDASNSRLWGGIHYRFDLQAGLQLGEQIGHIALAGPAFNAVPEPGTWAMFVAGFLFAGAALRRTRIGGTAGQTGVASAQQG